MIVQISTDADADIRSAYWFYEGQSFGLGDYFRDCILSDIDSLADYGGIHEISHGYQRIISKRFPYVIYYELECEVVTVVAVLDARRNPSGIRDRLS